jgi:hypothetical protein
VRKYNKDAWKLAGFLAWAEIANEINFLPTSFFCPHRAWELVWFSISWAEQLVYLPPGQKNSGCELTGNPKAFIYRD